MNNKFFKTTILLGLIYAVFFIPLTKILSQIIYYPLYFRACIWFYFAVYSIFMIRWADRKITSLFFPLLILFIFIYISSSDKVFLILTLAIFSWIRSGICFSENLIKLIFAEFIICFGSALLIYGFSPDTNISYAISIWLFFLCQSLYFVIFTKNYMKNKIMLEKLETDKFEQARKQAEKILAESCIDS